LADGKSFSTRVRYIHRKHPEKADLMIVNKLDAVSSSDVAGWKARLEDEYPPASVLAVSCRLRDGLNATLRIVADRPIDGQALVMDLADRMRRGRLIDNLRSEGAQPPLLDVLQSPIVSEAGRRDGVSRTMEHPAHSKPGRPEPTCRMPGHARLARCSG